MLHQSWGHVQTTYKQFHANQLCKHQRTTDATWRKSTQPRSTTSLSAREKYSCHMQHTRTSHIFYPYMPQHLLPNSPASSGFIVASASGSKCGFFLKGGPEAPLLLSRLSINVRSLRPSEAHCVTYFARESCPSSQYGFAAPRRLGTQEGQILSVCVTGGVLPAVAVG